METVSQDLRQAFLQKILKVFNKNLRIYFNINQANDG